MTLRFRDAYEHRTTQVVHFTLMIISVAEILRKPRKHSPDTHQRGERSGSITSGMDPGVTALKNLSLQRVNIPA